MAKTTSVVASYSGLYEEGEVDHINCPHPPSHQKRRSQSKAEENGVCSGLYRHEASGRMGGPKVIKVLSAEFYFHKPITVHLELYLFYCFIHFLLYIGQY